MDVGVSLDRRLYHLDILQDRHHRVDRRHNRVKRHLRVDRHLPSNKPQRFKQLAFRRLLQSHHQGAVAEPATEEAPKCSQEMVMEMDGLHQKSWPLS